MFENKFKPLNEMNPTETHVSVFARRFASKLTYKGKIVIEIAITYPHIDIRKNQHASHLLNRLYRDDAERYFNKASHELYGAAIKEYLEITKQNYPFIPYQAIQTYEIPYNRKNLLSIYHDQYENTSGMHGNTERFADTFQISSGKHLKLKDYFQDSYYKSVIFDYIANEITKQKEKGNSHYFDDHLKNVFRYFDENNYYLTDTGFAVFFQVDSIAACDQGVPVFIIPYESFVSVLKKEYLF